MVTSILTILKSLWNNKTLRYFILTVVLAIFLKVGYSLLTNHYYNTGYQNGVEHQVSIYKKEQDDLKVQYEERLKVKDKEKAMTYYEKSKERDPKGSWDWDEIETED